MIPTMIVFGLDGQLIADHGDDAGVGVGIHKGIAWTVRNLRSRHSPVEAAPLS